jgi:hypothetical protein
VGSNPTPRAYLEVLYELIKRKNTPISDIAREDKASYNLENQKIRPDKDNDKL